MFLVILEYKSCPPLVFKYDTEIDANETFDLHQQYNQQYKRAIRISLQEFDNKIPWVASFDVKRVWSEND